MNELAAFTPRDYWSLVVRRKWWILGSIVLSLAIAGALCQLLPKSYRSDATILVEEQQIPENYVKGIVEGSVEQRIFLIQQQVMSRTLLGEIVEKFNLYPEEIEENGLEAAIGQVRRALDIEMVGSAEGRRGPKRDLLAQVNAFRISFSHKDPVTAMKVTSSIASRFIEENLKTREKFVEGAALFLDYELDRAKAELENKEQEISQYKSQSMGKLPQQMDANLRTLDRLQSEWNNVNESIQRLGDRLSGVEKGVAEYQATGTASQGLETSHGKPDPRIGRLRELEGRLTSLSAEYTDSYPDIVLTRQEIAKVKSQLAEIYGSEAGTQGDKSYDPYLREIIKPRDELRNEIELLKKRRDLLTLERKQYEERVEKAPVIEQGLLILLRDYENMKDNYRSLLGKRINARVAENLEKHQKGEQFRILDPANLPNKPSSPNARKIMVLGLVLGCVAGFGLAYLLEGLNPTFRRPEDLEQLLGPQVVTVIPDFALVYGRSSRRRFLPVPERQSRPLLEYNAGPKTIAMNSKGVTASTGKRTSLEMNLITKFLPASVVAEQYRVAATHLSLLRAEHKSTIVAVTSSVQGEGKTTTVVNLAYTLARDLGKRTLMFECDFRCPMLHRYTQTPSEPGLADLLNEEIPLDACLYSLGEVPCSVMPVGRVGDHVNELIKNQRLVVILNALRERFDYILMNTPPILPVADMNVLAGLADLLLLVVRAGSTPQQVVKRALSRLRGVNPGCMILNAVDTTALPYYMDYSYRGEAPGERHA